MAPERVDQRTVRDLASIRAAHPAVRAIRVSPSLLNSLLVRLSEDAREAARRNNAVACLNQVYHAAIEPTAWR
ncbi:uncharacterized protein SOCE26_078450 [Sorangium cellulosum]|uniref:Uncharacterized protein n=1 Tax=Sorangium cellulosum TaxID=56 RepID=A0A2L0F4G4_SORCE|nr:hypothetical protein [Sorangium cellulosum]AUX46339.1 uncharacterized protein SOCE26_078450 [Sorangium cellulosum]